MLLQRRLSFLTLILLFLLPSLQVFAGTLPHLERPSTGERWFGIIFNDQRAGFAFVSVRGNRTGYELHGESSVKMSGFAFSRNASVRETYNVNPDLTLRSFTVNQTIDGTQMTVEGETSKAGVKTVIDSSGTKKEKLLKYKGAVYPPMAMNLIPLLKGAEPGKIYHVSMLDAEAVKIKKVKITVIGAETVGTTKAIHLQNDLYPVDNDIWVDFEGNTIKESVRDGWIVTQSEGEKIIRKFITEGALAKRDFIVDYSLVRTDRPISRPSAVTKMVLELSDFPADARILSSPVQKAVRRDDGGIIYTIDNSLLSAKEGATRDKEPGDYLKPEDRIQSDNPALLASKSEIIGDEKDPEKIIEKLTFWVAAHVKDSVSENTSPLDTIRKGEGDCLDHVRLYSSLARAAGIPTKIVLGLAYFQDRGFLYHCWAESYSGKWLPVDPTSGEVPANATHVKLAEGDTDEDLLALSKFVGKIKAKVLEQK